MIECEKCLWSIEGRCWSRRVLAPNGLPPHLVEHPTVEEARARPRMLFGLIPLKGGACGPEAEFFMEKHRPAPPPPPVRPRPVTLPQIIAIEHTRADDLSDCLRSAMYLLEEFTDNYVDTPPDRACTCMVAPPCEDCVKYSHLRDLLQDHRDLRDKVDALTKK